MSNRVAEKQLGNYAQSTEHYRQQPKKKNQKVSQLSLWYKHARRKIWEWIQRMCAPRCPFHQPGKSLLHPKFRKKRISQRICLNSEHEKSMGGQNYAAKHTGLASWANVHWRCIGVNYSRKIISEVNMPYCVAGNADHSFVCLSGGHSFYILQRGYDQRKAHFYYFGYKR